MAAFGRLTAALFILLIWGGAAWAQTEQRAALVIGNGAYVNVTKLKNPANDAKAMAAMLRRAGFDVTEREDTTRRAMIEATRSFAEKLSPGGIGLVFYAGHGIQARGANYLLPVDTALASEDDLKYEAIDVQDILNRLDDARVRLSLVILDACRDNPFARSFRSAGRGLAQIDAPRGSLIAYATAPGKTAADGDGENGVYTSELLKAMSEPGRKLQEVFEHVTDAVERRTANAQTPWISSSFRGDFYFIPPATGDTTPKSATLPTQPSEAQEQAAWAAVVGSTTSLPYEAFLTRFPNGVFADIARAKIVELKSKQALVTTPPPSPSSSPDKAPRMAKRVKTLQDGTRYDGEFLGDSLTGRGVRTWPDGARYDGELLDGKQNGRGVKTWPNGDRYEGEYREDRREGRGVYAWANGVRYEGDFRDDEMTGRAIKTWTDGGRYEGEFRDGKESGRGIYTWASGDRYEGEYRDDKRNGRGVYIWASGVRYEGEFHDNAMTGRGVKTWTNGDRYDGEFRDGRENGRGIYVWANGVRYDGEFRDDSITGRGVKTWVDGARYEGEFVDAKENGRGVYTWPTGDRYVGEYRDDKRNGRGIYTWANGVRYDGEFRDNAMTGRAIKTWVNGVRYDGYWIDGLRNGHGVETWPDGGRYEGEWRNDMANGAGKYVNKTGTYTGTWTNGCLSNGGKRAWVEVDSASCR